MPTTHVSSPEPLLVACLCAQWCGVCRDYEPLLRAPLAAWDATQVVVKWVDIEDHEAALGDLDVQSFPTLLIARGGEALFFGTVTPHAQTLERLVQRALAGDRVVGAVGEAEDEVEDVRALVARVQALPLAA